jgi:suppressor for copper-sensitivity B
MWGWSTGLLAILLCAVEATAAGWVTREEVAFRLLAAQDSVADGQSLLVGVEARLQPGWKLYWRSPGRDGLPPRFDFSRSTNVASASVRWPAPARLEIPTMRPEVRATMIGYKDDVVFPIQLRIAQPGQQVDLRLRLRYGVCNEEGCSGDEVRLNLTLPAGTGARSAAADLIDAAMARCPVDASAGGVTVADLRVVDAGRGVVVSLDAQAPLKAPDLLLETPQGHYFSEPAVTVRKDGRAATFRAEVLRGKAAPLSPGTPVTLTILGGPRAIEVTVPLASP